jgi:hypothetical protein
MGRHIQGKVSAIMAVKTNGMTKGKLKSLIVEIHGDLDRLEDLLDEMKG